MCCLDAHFHRGIEEYVSKDSLSAAGQDVVGLRDFGQERVTIMLISQVINWVSVFDPYTMVAECDRSDVEAERLQFNRHLLKEGFSIGCPDRIADRAGNFQHDRCFPVRGHLGAPAFGFLNTADVILLFRDIHPCVVTEIRNVERDVQKPQCTGSKTVDLDAEAVRRVRGDVSYERRQRNRRKDP